MKAWMRSILGVAAGILVASTAILLLSRDAKSEPATPEPPEVVAASPGDRGERTSTLALDTPHGAHPIVWVRTGEKVAIHTEPGGGKVAEVVNRWTEWGSPTVFGVQRNVKGWAGVSTPALSNDQLGWVRLDPERVRGGWVEDELRVDLSERRVEVRKRGKLVRSFTATVGAAGSTTPIGRFAVTDTFRGGLLPDYGCCAVATSATQPNLPSGWLGGSRIAFHGTDGPLGVAASHGCIRTANEDVDLLVDRVALGTPVAVRQ